MSDLCDDDIEDLALKVQSNQCRSFVWAAQEFASFILARRRIPGPTNSAIELPGWTCLKCRCFNGEAKERRMFCRHCGMGRADLVQGG